MANVMLIVISVVSVLLIIVMTWLTLKTLDEYLELKLGNSEEKFKASLRERQLDSARRALEFKEDFKQILTEELGLDALKEEPFIKLQELKEELGALKEETAQLIKLQELQEKVNKLQEKTNKLQEKE